MSTSAEYPVLARLQAALASAMAAHDETEMGNLDIAICELRDVIDVLLWVVEDLEKTVDR